MTINQKALEAAWEKFHKVPTHDYDTGVEFTTPGQASRYVVTKMLEAYEAALWSDDMDAAPKDGTWIFAYSDNEWPIICRWANYYSNLYGDIATGKFWMRMGDTKLPMGFEPTHWRPLPGGPTG